MFADAELVKLLHTLRYKEAYRAFLKALEGRPREYSAFYWALAHYNAGVTLINWSEIEPDRERLIQADAHMRSALEVFTENAVLTHQHWAEAELQRASELLDAMRGS